MATIPVTGITSGWRLPGVYSEVLFAQGPASGGVDAREIVFVMPKSSAGTWTANTLIEITDESQLRAGAGVGSPLYRAALKAIRTNRTAKYWALPYAETTGGTPVKAVTTVVCAGPATSATQWTLTVCGTDITVFCASGDSASTIATAMRAAINSADYLPVVASGSTGDVTLTARLYGIRGGTSTYKPIRIRSNTPGGGLTITNPGDLGSTTAGADGTTTEAATFATAIANIDGVHKYFIVTDQGDATGNGNLKTHLAAKAAPRVGMRSVGISAYNGTLANATTLANGLNYERYSIAWQPFSDHDPAELAGGYAAIRHLGESDKPQYNFNGYNTTGIFLPVHASLAQYIPDAGDQNDAILAGLTCIANNASGSGSQIVKTSTTKVKDTSGAVADFRASETHRIACTDWDVEDMQNTLWQAYSNTTLEPDPVKSDGTIDWNKANNLGSGAICPVRVKGYLLKKFDEWDAAKHIQQKDAMVASLVVIKDSLVGGKVGISFDHYSIDITNQFATRVSEVSGA